MSPSNKQNPDPALSERTPLLPPPPTAADAPPEALIDTEPTDHDDDSPSKLSDGHTTANQSITLVRGAITTLALGALIFLQATNISLLSTIQSSIADDLDAHDSTTWFTSAYLIAMSSLGPLNGKLAAVFSPRVCIFAAAVFLAIGTVVSGLAAGFAGFLAGRILTGIGASGVFTVSIIIVLELTGSKRRGLAIGALNSGYTLGVAVGATAAGALLPVIGWRWLFLGQAPIALLGGSVLLLSIPKSFSTGPKSGKSLLHQVLRLDYLGAVTLTVTIVLILYSLSSPKKIPLLPLLLSILSLAAFLIVETRLASDPIIPVALLKSRGLLLTCFGTVGYMMSRWAVLFYTPTYAIAVRAWTSGTAGALLIPTNVGFAVGGILVGWLHIRRQGSFYLATLLVYALFPVTLLLLAGLTTHSGSIALFVLDLVACGAVTGAALNYNLAHVLHLTPPSTHYVTTSLLATFRGFSGSFGSAVGGGLFTRTLYRALSDGFAQHGMKRDELVRRLLGSPALVAGLDGVERDVAVAGYEQALRALFLAGAALSALTVLVQAGTGWKGAEDGDDSHRESEGSGEETIRDEDG